MAPGEARISIIVPVLDEAAAVVDFLRPLQAFRRRGHELLVIDGGSVDGTPSLARPLCDHVLTSARGRALQMNAGAAAATCEVLLFLHADTVLPQDADRSVLGALGDGAEWGHFDVRLWDHTHGVRGHCLLALVERMMNLRSRLTGIATGDQAMFVRRDVFDAVRGFPSIALMEDVALSGNLRRRSRPACLRSTVVTSSRRWTDHGVLRTIVLMWQLRLAYFLGADPDVLAVRYRRR